MTLRPSPALPHRWRAAPPLRTTTTRIIIVIILISSPRRRPAKSVCCSNRLRPLAAPIYYLRQWKGFKRRPLNTNEEGRRLLTGRPRRSERNKSKKKTKRFRPNPKRRKEICTCSALRRRQRSLVCSPTRAANSSGTEPAAKYPSTRILPPRRCFPLRRRAHPAASGRLHRSSINSTSTSRLAAATATRTLRSTTVNSRRSRSPPPPPAPPLACRRSIDLHFLASATQLRTHLRMLPPRPQPLSFPSVRMVAKVVTLA